MTLTQVNTHHTSWLQVCYESCCLLFTGVKMCEVLVNTNGDSLAINI